MKAGTPIDTSNAPVAVETPKKEEKPVPLTEAEKLRNSVVRIAASGQEAVNINNVGVEAVAARYAKKEEDKVDGRQDAEGATKAAVEESLKDAKAAKDQ